MSSFFSSSGGGGSGSVVIPELYADSANPAPQSAWVLKTTEPPGGMPIGMLLALTYTGSGSTYQFSYRTLENSTVRTEMI